MKLAIIGPAFSGKTTVLNALTGSAEPTSDFSGGGSTHLRDVAVPDPRLDRLAKDYEPKKVTPARIEFLDMPAYGGEKYFGDVRTHEALIRVVRAFRSENVPHPKQRVDWRADLADVDADCVIQDLAMVERRIEKLERSSAKPSKTQKEEQAELELFRKALPGLSDGKALKHAVTDPEDRRRLAPFGFLTLKPTLTLVNLGDDDDPQKLGIPPLPDLDKGTFDDVIVPIKARLESEVAQLDDADRAAFLADFGLSEPIREKVIRVCYGLLGLQSFLTAGPKEVRAWTIKRSCPAVEAARVIHTDIARGFVRAEVVAWSDYLACGGWKQAKEANKLRLEGRDYAMVDGDVVEFRHAG